MMTAISPYIAQGFQTVQIHERCIFKSNCQLFCQFLLVNLCGLEPLCDIRRDCCHHFVSKRDFRRDAKGVCQAETSLMSPLVGMKRAS